MLSSEIWGVLFVIMGLINVGAVIEYENLDKWSIVHYTFMALFFIVFGFLKLFRCW